MLQNNPLRIAARALALAWGGWWTFFAIASALSERGSSPFSPYGLLICVLAVLFFMGTALAPWLSERIGGALLTLAGLALCVANYTVLHNPPATQWLLLLILAMPPLLAGTLFLTLHLRIRPSSG
jgi:hypothetical protein